ncbi:MAG: phage terminase large subunit, partial [Plesiomonas shigelloides]
TRIMSFSASTFLIQTRWHEDDLVGRLTDPANPHYNEAEAHLWELIKIPAIAKDADDSLGREVGEPLSPEVMRREDLDRIANRSPRVFLSQYQQEPTPPDGQHVREDMLKTYTQDLPNSLRMYCCSDHALGLKEHNDYTAMIAVGVDHNDNIWIIDVFNARIPIDHAVDNMLRFMRQYNPTAWFLEKDNITSSMFPFLNKRLSEEQVFGTEIIDLSASKDKLAKAQSIIGRINMGKMRFPEKAIWWPALRQQLLKFPQAPHDDMVDALGCLGRGLDKLLRGSALPVMKRDYAVGTYGWLKTLQREAERKNAKAQGW